MTQCPLTDAPIPPSSLPSPTPSRPISGASCALYGDPDAGKMPRSLAQLLTRVAQVIRAHTEAVDHAFVANLIGSLKSLRAHAISLTHDMHQAEDLVQKTVLKAINKQEEFEAGTNLQAWRFTTLRNLFFSGRRTKQREVEDTDGTHAATMITIPDQEAHGPGSAYGACQAAPRAARGPAAHRWGGPRKGSNPLGPRSGRSRAGQPGEDPPGRTDGARPRR